MNNTFFALSSVNFKKNAMNHRLFLLPSGNVTLNLGSFHDTLDSCDCAENPFGNRCFYFVLLNVNTTLRKTAETATGGVSKILNFFSKFTRKLVPQSLF